MTTVFLISAILSSPNLIATDVSEYLPSLLPLPNGGILFVTEDSEIMQVTPHTYQLVPWDESWDWARLGWAGVQRCALRAVSPDGETICCSFTVDPGVDIPFPEVVVLFDASGENGRPICLTMEVGAGPVFSFTLDSKRIYGNPILSCETDAESYIESMSGGDYQQIEMIDLTTGEISHHQGYLSDGFFPSPLSDLVTCGFPATAVYDVMNSRLVFESAGFSSYIDRWVLPDAGIAWEGDNQVLRYSSGGEIVNPGDPLELHFLTQDGLCLFSLRGSVLFGEVDWESFKPVDCAAQPALEDLLTRNNCMVNGGDVFFMVDDSLFACPLEGI